jgi:hypothetical protein
MDAISLNLPEGTVVKGMLLRHYDIEDLDQEILEVDLPSGQTIDVGWYPQYDAEGSFQISVYRDYWENREQKPVFTKTPESVAMILREIAFRFSAPRAVKNSKDQTFTRRFGASPIRFWVPARC